MNGKYILFFRYMNCFLSKYKTISLQCAYYKRKKNAVVNHVNPKTKVKYYMNVLF